MDANGNSFALDNVAATGEQLNAMKSNMKLDFDNKSARKRPLPPPQAAWTPSSALLNSPDLKHFNLSTPEIESMIGNVSGLKPRSSSANRALLLL